MIRLQFMAYVDEPSCTGCKLCEPVCPAGAIKVVARKATVDAGRCIDCQRCIDRCKKENAVQRIPRPAEVVRYVDHTDLDPALVKSLCAKADLLPHLPVCGCTRTMGQEMIAAILKGAKTPEDICARTGIRAGCGIYCATRLFQALEACGVEAPVPADRRFIKLTLRLADLSAEQVAAIDAAYPACHLGEDWRKVVQRRPASGRKEGAHV